MSNPFVSFNIDQFQSQVPEEQAGQYLEQERQRNQVIEQVLQILKALLCRRNAVTASSVRV